MEVDILQIGSGSHVVLLPTFFFCLSSQSVGRLSLEACSPSYPLIAQLLLVTVASGLSLSAWCIYRSGIKGVKTSSLALIPPSPPGAQRRPVITQSLLFSC